MRKPAPSAEAPNADVQPEAPRRKRARKTAAAAAPGEQTPDVVPPETAPPEAARPRHRRTPLKHARLASAEGQAAGPEQPAEAPPPAEPQPQPPAAQAEEVAKPRRRRSRRTRGADRGEPAAERPAAEAEPAQAAEAPAAAEPDAAGAEPAGAETSRRKRRGSRGRRGKPDSARDDAAAAPAAETVADAAPQQEAPAEPPARTPARGERARRVRVPVEVDAEEPAPAALPIVGRLPGPDPEPPFPIDTTVGAHLVWNEGGLPEIHIDSVAHAPILFFGNMETAESREVVQREVAKAAECGVHLHSTLVELPCPPPDSGDALEAIDERLRAILSADPDGWIMPRIVFAPARGWRREHHSELSSYADGSVGDPSITSELFWEGAERSIERMIRHLRETPWGRRVCGYHLERGEWFHPAEQGFDRSIANREAFRDWLRDKYRDNVVALRASWHDGEVQFNTVDIPAPPAKPSPNLAFYESRRQRRLIDFNEFTSESTARRLVLLARAVKRASDYRALVSVCYGYTFEFGHPASGHLALAILEASSAIDIIAGPPSYRDRKPGGAASFPSPVDSPPLHGKLWLSEDDTKTYLAPAVQQPDDFNPRLGDRYVTEQAFARAMGRSLSQISGIAWMDLWGEGWLDDSRIWDRIGDLCSLTRSLPAAQSRAEEPDVAVLIDEKSLLHVQRGEPFFRKLTNGLRDILQRAGISYGVYLQSDVTSPRFPSTCKLYIFATPYRLTEEQCAAIRSKLHRDDKTLAWLYAPGVCFEYPGAAGLADEAAHTEVGFTLQEQEWNSEVGSRITEPYHPLTERMGTRDLGVRERLNPSLYVADRDATVLAEYHGSGLPSVAVKLFGGWKSVFIGEPVLPLELLRGLCRYAGVHVWTPNSDDVCSIRNGWVTIHAARDGHRALILPHGVGLYDMTERRFVADEAREFRFFMRLGSTRTFCLGSATRFIALGLPNATLPEQGRERIVLSQPQEAKGEAPADRPRTDKEIFEAVLSIDKSELDAAELEVTTIDGLIEVGETEPQAAAESAAPSANGRRRRRRGGRGRWRRRAGGPESGASESGASESGAQGSPGEPPPPGPNAAGAFED
jgi:hypothetical protein